MELRISISRDFLILSHRVVVRSVFIGENQHEPIIVLISSSAFPFVRGPHPQTPVQGHIPCESKASAATARTTPKSVVGTRHINISTLNQTPRRNHSFVTASPPSPMLATPPRRCVTAISRPPPKQRSVGVRTMMKAARRTPIGRFYRENGAIPCKVSRNRIEGSQSPKQYWTMRPNCST